MPPQCQLLRANFHWRLVQSSESVLWSSVSVGQILGPATPSNPGQLASRMVTACLAVTCVRDWDLTHGSQGYEVGHWMGLVFDKSSPVDLSRNPVDREKAVGGVQYRCGKGESQTLRDWACRLTTPLDENYLHKNGGSSFSPVTTNAFISSHSAFVASIAINFLHGNSLPYSPNHAGSPPRQCQSGATIGLKGLICSKLESKEDVTTGQPLQVHHSGLVIP